MPKALRDQLGLVAGPVEVTATGAGPLVEPLTAGLVEQDGMLVIEGGGSSISGDELREFRCRIQSDYQDRWLKT